MTMKTDFPFQLVEMLHVAALQPLQQPRVFFTESEGKTKAVTYF